PPTVAGVRLTSSGSGVWFMPLYPKASNRWMFQVDSSPLVDVHAEAVSGYPLGGFHASGACPAFHSRQYMLTSELTVSVPGLTPSTRAVATRPSCGRRVLAPTAGQNSSEENGVR